MDRPLIDFDDDVSTPLSSPLNTPPPPRYSDCFCQSSDGGGGCGDGDDDDDEFQYDAVSSKSIESTSKPLDCMLRFLDRKLSNEASSPQNDGSSLPEFVAKGGGTGIFKLPVRYAMHPVRPPCLELRPHPLRESQIASFLRTVTATDSQLWAGRECGVRVWDFEDLYQPGVGDLKTGDEYTAPFRESASTSPTTCLLGDEGSRVVWSGHIDGRIRCWKMMMSDHICESWSRFKESFSWQSHRGPVLSLIITSYGDLWSGSEGGVIRIWPWETVEKSLSLASEEWHMATLLVERSCIDLQSQLSVNGFSNILTSDVKYLLADNSRAKVWSAGCLSFALWDARTRELLRVFNMDGQIEHQVDSSSSQDFSIEYASSSKKEKMHGSFGFFQRSCNAIMGAADAVRRFAVKGAFGDDNRRTEALVMTIDGMIWTGCTSGLLVQWDGNGNRIQDFHHHPFAVQCLCTFGPRVWVGYASGTVQILDLGGTLLGGWVAHSSPVIEITVGADYIFTLANHGGIRGWNITSPGPLDSILRSELAGKEFLYTKIENVKILSGTWNVGQGRASHDSLVSWLGSRAKDVGIVVVGLQEVEMGAGVFALSAAKETVGLEGSTVGQWWLDMIGQTLDEGSTFEHVGSRQLAGLLISVWVRNSLRAHVGDIDAAAVPCGFGRAIGNKGAVGLRLRVYDRIFCFVNCHFAAHLEAVKQRNADFDHVYRTMKFCRPTNVFNAATVGSAAAVQMLRGTNVIGEQTAEGMPELSESDFVIFLGDLNYRLDGIAYDEARDIISQRCFDRLRERDQLLTEMEAGNVFQGMREAVISFPPTYKFERHKADLAGYDSSEKKRIPAWCDRVLYRDSRSALLSGCSLACPVLSSIVRYEACMDVMDSDHKPVRCIFNVDIARADESIRRQELGKILGSNEKIRYMHEELHKIPETIVSSNNIILQSRDTSILHITNKSRKNYAFFEIICEGLSSMTVDGLASDHHPRGSFGFPRWLQVTPAAGIIRPNHIAEVSVHHNEFQTLEFVDGVPQDCWCEHNRDTEIILVIRVRGSCTTKARNHRVCVCPLPHS